MNSDKFVENSGEARSYSSRTSKKLGKIAIVERQALAQLKSQLHDLEKKYRITDQDIIHLLHTEDHFLAIPLTIFQSQKGPLEALVCYLKDQCGFGFAKIGQLLNRDDRTIWTTYHQSQSKAPSTTIIDEQTPTIPLSKINSRKRSILENIAVYLRDDRKMSNKQVGSLLGRAPTTIWTAYTRGKAKNA